MADNIVGVPFSTWVKNQIEHREKVLGKTTRSPEETLYMNNKGAWVRVASSVFIEKDLVPGFRNDNWHISNAPGDELAKNFVLFGGTATNSQSNLPLGGIVPNSDTRNNFIEASKYSYGLGSSDYGFTAPPGIDSVKVRHHNSGAVRKYEIKLKAQNLDQFEIIEALYLRLGYYILIEWGHTSYFTEDDDGNFVYQSKPNYITPAFTSFFNGDTSQVRDNLKLERKNRSGNYDGGIAKIDNFNWTFNPDGSYDVTISAVGLGGLVDSLLMNFPGPNLEGDGLTTIRYELKNLTPNQKKEKAQDLGNPLPEGENVDNEFRKVVSKFFSQGEKGYQTLLDNGIIQEEGATAGGSSLDTLTFDDYAGTVFVDQYKSVLNNKLLTEILNLKNEKLSVWKQDDNGNNRYKTKKDDNSKDYISIKFENGDSKEKDKEAYYMRLSTLLQFINEKILPLNQKQTSTIPEIKQAKNFLGIKIDEQYMFTHWFQNSANPLTCLIPFKARDLDNDTEKEFLYDILGSKFRENGEAKGKEHIASLYDIHVNFEFIAKTLREAEDETRNIKLYLFLSKLMDGIQLALGDINKFTVTYDEENNYILIQDDTKIEGLTPAEQPATSIRAYGVNVNDERGSFVKNISMVSQISPKLATEIAIGAVATGDTINNNASLLGRWNLGYVDRCQLKDVQSQTNKDDGKDLLDILRKQYDTYWEFITSTYQDFNAPTDSNIDTSLANLPPLLDYDLGIKTLNGEIAGKGFIPINLTVSLDGLSGVLRFQKFNLTPNILPRPYTDSIDFVIKSIDHTIIGNEWTTTYETLSIPKWRPVGNQTEKSSSTDGKFSIFKKIKEE